MDQVAICVAAFCGKQDGLMWLQLLKVFVFLFLKDKNIGQVEVCVAAICAKHPGLMCMHLFEKNKKKRWIRLRFVLQPPVQNKLGSCACICLKKLN